MGSIYLIFEKNLEVNFGLKKEFGCCVNVNNHNIPKEFKHQSELKKQIKDRNNTKFIVKWNIYARPKFDAKPPPFFFRTKVWKRGMEDTKSFLLLQK